MDRDGGNDAVGLRVDHGDRAGLRVDDVNLVSNGISGKVGGVVADLQGPVLAEVHEIEHGDVV